jgi:hypothetical protein
MIVEVIEMEMIVEVIEMEMIVEVIDDWSERHKTNGWVRFLAQLSSKFLDL